jgi:hypothetical protein
MASGARHLIYGYFQGYFIQQFKLSSTTSMKSPKKKLNFTNKGMDLLM